MNPSKLADSILNKIENENLKPRSKYYFVFRNFTFWGLFSLALLLGSISFAIIIYAAVNTDFSIGEFVEGKALISQWLNLLPLLWFLIIGIAIGLGIVGLKHTKRGYRIALVTLIAGNIFGSVALGSGLYAVGGASVIENTLDSKVERYKSVREKYQQFWGRPEIRGLLAGQVTDVDETRQLISIEGPRGNSFQVPYGEAFPLKTTPEIGSMLKMKGRLENNTFRPERIKRAPRHQQIQQRIENFRSRQLDPNQRRTVPLAPDTKQAIREHWSNGERLSPELRNKIRMEFQESRPNSRTLR